MKNIKKEISTQEWLPFDRILENGIIISENFYIKIIKVMPINYDLKSNLEKEAILNSYKQFLKTCDFNIQILIQSKKENLSKQISILDQINLKESNEKIKQISKRYKFFIEEKNKENKSSTKEFYIITRIDADNKVKDIEKNTTNLHTIIQTLNDYFFKIKESLSRCGNLVYDINSKNEVQNILNSFLNPNNENKF